tara:strand:+ start:347 stop:745 length:399 start_codon:yes stop_codon:yes gene_type:complete
VTPSHRPQTCLRAGRAATGNTITLDRIPLDGTTLTSTMLDGTTLDGTTLYAITLVGITFHRNHASTNPCCRGSELAARSIACSACAQAAAPTNYAPPTVYSCRCPCICPSVRPASPTFLSSMGSCIVTLSFV